MKKIIWQQGRDKIWRVINFPYFRIVVRHSLLYNKYPYKVEYHTNRNTQEYFSTLNEAQQAALKYCLNRLEYINFKYVERCWWAGNGIYCKGYKWKHYHWLESNYEKLLRFPMETSKEEVITIGEKIMNRHKTRFIEIMNNLT